MLLEWFILTHIIAVVCCSILFGQTYTCYTHLYATISTITSLTIYTRLVFQLYHINFVSYLLCPLRFDIIVNRQFCLQLFQCRILIINTGYSLKNHPINRQSRSCSTVLSVFYDSITRPSKWKKITTLLRLLLFFLLFTENYLFLYVIGLNLNSNNRKKRKTKYSEFFDFYFGHTLNSAKYCWNSCVQYSQSLNIIKLFWMQFKFCMHHSPTTNTFHTHFSYSPLGHPETIKV